MFFFGELFEKYIIIDIFLLFWSFSIFESAFVYDSNSFGYIRQEGNVLRLIDNPHRYLANWLVTVLSLWPRRQASLAKQSHYNAQQHIDHFAGSRAGFELQLQLNLFPVALSL